MADYTAAATADGPSIDDLCPLLAAVALGPSRNLRAHAQQPSSDASPKAFPLMDLPTELRLYVYEFALQDTLNSIVAPPFGKPKPGRSKRPLSAGPGSSFVSPNEYVRCFPLVGALALLHTSREVRAETTDAFERWASAHRDMLEVREDCILKGCLQERMARVPPFKSFLERLHEASFEWREALEDTYVAKSIGNLLRDARTFEMEQRRRKLKNERIFAKTAVEDITAGNRGQESVVSDRLENATSTHVQQDMCLPSDPARNNISTTQPDTGTSNRHLTIERDRNFIRPVAGEGASSLRRLAAHGRYQLDTKSKLEHLVALDRGSLLKPSAHLGGLLLKHKDFDVKIGHANRPVSQKSLQRHASRKEGTSSPDHRMLHPKKRQWQPDQYSPSLDILSTVVEATQSIRSKRPSLNSIKSKAEIVGSTTHITNTEDRVGTTLSYKNEDPGEVVLHTHAQPFESSRTASQIALTSGLWTEPVGKAVERTNIHFSDNADWRERRQLWRLRQQLRPGHAQSHNPVVLLGDDDDGKRTAAGGKRKADDCAEHAQKKTKIEPKDATSEHDQQAFRLMDLPVELRLRIYQHAVQGLVDTVVATTYSRAQFLPRLPLFYGPFAFLHANSVVRSETWKALPVLLQVHLDELTARCRALSSAAMIADADSEFPEWEDLEWRRIVDHKTVIRMLDDDLARGMTVWRM